MQSFAKQIKCSITSGMENLPGIFDFKILENDLKRKLKYYFISIKSD